MNIGFWSMNHGQGCTSNLTALATVLSIIYEKRTVMLQSHFERNHLEDIFLPSAGSETEREYYMDIGYDALVRHILSGTITEQSLTNCTISLYEEKLALLPGTRQNMRTEYELQALKYLPYLIRALKKKYNNVFVDLESGKNKLSHELMKEFDVIVINLRQSFLYTEKISELYNVIPKEKRFYLFSMYDDNSRNSMKNLRRIYKSELNRNNSACIPYNISFSDAISSKQLINFIEGNQNADRVEINRNFIEEVKNSACRIMELAGRERTDQNEGVI